MERVTLNVGGQLFTTTLATLRSFGDETTLGDLSLKPGIENQDDPVFLDRDPVLFQHVLNCMRHRRIFNANQLDLSPSIWELELAYYGLPIEKEKKEQPKKRPIDVVNEREEKQKKLADSQRKKIEAVLMWMLSFYSGKEIRFAFASFDRASVKNRMTCLRRCLRWMLLMSKPLKNNGNKYATITKSTSIFGMTTERFETWALQFLCFQKHY